MSSENTQKKSKYWILPLCILLLILVFASGILLGTRIGKFTDVEPYTEIVIEDEDSSENDKKDDKQDEPFVPEPGMAIGGQSADGSVETDISIFKATYANENDEITVRSLGGDKVVAPGTSNTHVIRIMNTGNCALDYELYVKDLFPDIPADKTIPIEIRMTSSNGKYVIGTKDKWVTLTDLHIKCHAGTVAKSSYVYYTLEWRWPFEIETNTDVYDTLLGTLSNTEKIECGIKITTIAEPNPDPNAEGGFWVPQTGDYANAVLWICLSGVALLVIVLLLLGSKRKKDETL